MKRRIAYGMVAIGVALAPALAPAAPAAAAERTYKVVFGFSGKCMEPSAPSRGSVLSQWTCDGAAFQQWYFDYVGHDAQGAVHWRIRNAQSGMCIYNDRDYLFQGQCGWAMTFKLIPAQGTIYHRLETVRLFGLCATLSSADQGGTANGAKVYLAGCGVSGIDPKQQYVELY